MKTFRVCTWQTEYKKVYLEAETAEQAKTMALDSLDGFRDDVAWSVFDRDGGYVEEIDEV